MSRKKLILLVIIIVLAAAGFYAYKEYNRVNADVSGLQADYNIAATDLLKEFTANDSVANKKYLGKIIAVKGIVRQVSKDENGYCTIVLGDTSSSMSSIRCSVDSVHTPDVINLGKGKTITVKGSLTGFKPDDTGLLGSDIEMNRCVL